MAKPKTHYTCNACGAGYGKWTGQCADCGAWNTLEEAVTAASGPPYAGHGAASAVQNLADVQLEREVRSSSHIDEFDRALGGGIVLGSVVLIGGDPGIGKSTLLLQALARAAELKPLYVSGEESAQQISLRARRLGLQAAGLQFLAETRVERILTIASEVQPALMVIDSIQTLLTEQLQSAPGSVTQVRESAAHLVRFAKQTHTTVLLVGHVTKEGALAGPRVLEHMVDTVLYFEGNPDDRYRVLRAIKNRFGAVNEIGVFAMSDKGLVGVSNPSAIFITRQGAPAPGSVVMVTREGTRPLLVELQALVDASHIANPRRITVGLDHNRLTMLLAVLHRHGGTAMYDQDVFVNVVGGVRVTETAADLAVVFAILSSFKDRALPADLVVFGEVGLAGEIRPIPNGQARLHEAAKHGFRRAIIPLANRPKKAIPELKIEGVERLAEVLEKL